MAENKYSREFAANEKTELRRYTHRMRSAPYKGMFCRMISKPMVGSYKMPVAVLIDEDTGKEVEMILNRGCVRALRKPIAKRYKVTEDKAVNDEEHAQD